ncbi:SecY-interacting protein [Rosenbergiella sp. S61]|uniref:Protein Syd n=1 Tax=Rosenbergiella gaditana TaxID=2726987 RepID=A0ABS5SU78_9GAMM|nr:SecY-interacting protein [Rosenbergiella gaditana]MBT0723432.1 SecY-interacting protein [Rosenbergiella gaditana]
MLDETSQQLRDFTLRYCRRWQQDRQSAPVNEQLIGVDSPCLLTTNENGITWQPQPFTLAKNLDAVSKGVDLVLQPSVVAFYTTQFAAEMTAIFEGMPLTLLQAWNEEDFTLLQQNLVGHLVMKRRLKHSPTLFIATTEEDSTIIAVDNLAGNVILEVLGKNQNKILAPSLSDFLQALHPQV